MFCLLAFNLFGKWGFDTGRRAIRLYMNVFCSKPDGILARNQPQMPWTTRRALPLLSTAFWAQTTTRSPAWRRLLEPARRNWPLNLQWILNRWIRWICDRTPAWTAASVRTAERFCTRLPVRTISLFFKLQHFYIFYLMNLWCKLVLF